MSEQSSSGMFTDAEHDPRTLLPQQDVGEIEVVVGYLERYRLTIELKCQGLDAEQLARRSVPPSTLSLLGLVRHLAYVEAHWARRIIEGRTDVTPPFVDVNDPDVEFTGALADPALVDQAWQSWHAEVAHAREVVAALPDWGATVQVHGEPVEIRDVMVHLVEEYARHAGHADLLREAIDGRTGQ